MFKLAISIFALLVGFLLILEGNAKLRDNQRVVDKASLFTTYDKNNDNVLTLGEISENDSHLHRVLDVDLTRGVSFEEFQTRGKMQWLPGKRKDGQFPARDWSERTQVEFNLESSQKVQINAWTLTSPPRNTIQVADRLVIWSMIDDRAALVLDEITIMNDANGKISSSFKRPYYPSKTYKRVILSKEWK